MASFDLIEIMRKDMGYIDDAVGYRDKAMYMGIQWSNKWRKDIVMSDIQSHRLVHYNFDRRETNLVKGLCFTVEISYSFIDKNHVRSRKHRKLIVG